MLREIVFTQNFIIIIACIGTLITSLEYLFNIKLFFDHEIISWRVVQVQRKWTLNKQVNIVLNQLFTPNSIKLIIIIQLLISIILPILTFFNSNLINVFLFLIHFYSRSQKY